MENNNGGGATQLPLRKEGLRKRGKKRGLNQETQRKKRGGLVGKGNLRSTSDTSSKERSWEKGRIFGLEWVKEKRLQSLGVVLPRFLVRVFSFAKGRIKSDC